MDITTLQELVNTIRKEHEGILGLVREAECVPVIEYLMDRDFEVHVRLMDAEKTLAALSF